MGAHLPSRATAAVTSAGVNSAVSTLRVAAFTWPRVRRPSPAHVPPAAAATASRRARYSPGSHTGGAGRTRSASLWGPSGETMRWGRG